MRKPRRKGDTAPIDDLSVNTPPTPDRPSWPTLLGLYLLPVFLTLLFMYESRGNPFYRYQFSDEEYYLRWAADFASGKGFGPHPFYISPLYVYFLTILHWLGARSIGAIRVVQILLGGFSYLLVHLQAARLFGRRAGFLAYALALGYGVLLQSNTDLSPPWMETLLLLLVGWILAHGISGRTMAAAGLVTGVAALSRPTMLFFAAMVPAGLYLLQRNKGRRGYGWVAGAAVFLASFALPILPVTLRNVVVGKELVMISTHGGINFYIGNSPGAPGTIYGPEDIECDLMSINTGKVKELAEQAAGHPLSDSAVSSYWYRCGFSFLLGHPGKAAVLYARKLLFSVHSYEAATNSDYYLFRERSWLLKLLPVSFALLLILGAAGIVHSLRAGSWPKLLFPVLLMAGQMLLMVVFFVAYRFRLPLAPLLAVSGGYALQSAWEKMRSRPTALIAPAALGLAVLMLLSYPYAVIEDMMGDSRATQHENLGVYLVNRGLVDEAQWAFGQAVTIRPSLKVSHWFLARILEWWRNDPAGAMREWRMTAELYGPQSEWGREAMNNYERLRRSSAER